MQPTANIEPHAAEFAPIRAKASPPAKYQRADTTICPAAPSFTDRGLRHRKYCAQRSAPRTIGMADVVRQTPTGRRPVPPSVPIHDDKVGHDPVSSIALTITT